MTTPANDEQQQNDQQSLQRQEAESQGKKMVPESDLLAVKSAKQAAEAKLSDLSSQFAKLQASFSDISGKFKELQNVQTQFNDLKAKHEATSKELEEQRKRLAEAQKEQMSTKYGLDKSKLDGLSDAEFSAVQLAFDKLGFPPNPHDTGSGGAASGGKSEDERLKDRYPSMYKAK